MSMASTVRVIVVGLDGATWDLLKPWAESGKLPTIKWLMENGVWGDLETVIPPLSAPAWTSFITGKNPGNHGIYNFVLKKENSYDIIFVNSIIQRKLSRRLWDYLAFKNFKSIIINLMPSYPPENINGILISDILTTPAGKNFIYPNHLMSELKSNIGEYDIEPLEDLIIGSDDSKFLKRLFKAEEQRIKYFKYLLENYDWNLAVLVLSGSDNIQHAFWNYLDPTHPFYDPKNASEYKNKVISLFKMYDDLLKYLISTYQDAIIFVVSDHGHGPSFKYFNLPFWLKKKGYLKFKRSPTTIIKLLLFSNLFDIVYSIMGKLGIIEKVKHIFLRGKSYGSRKRSLLSLIFDYLFVSWKDIDWNNTTAFVVSSGGQIYINLKGREPQGIVPPEEYESIREKIKKELENIIDPETGKKVIYKVFKKEELYSGKYLENAPDLICLPNKGYVIQYPQVYKPKLFEVSKIAGTHTSINELRGILIVYGPSIKKGMKIQGAKIYDITPTILHIFGLPIPKDIDGKILKDIFDDSSELAKREPKYVDPDYYNYYNKKNEKEMIRSKIRKLKSRGII